MKLYPGTVTKENVADVVQQIVRLRNAEDVQSFNNLQNTFIGGRLTARVPASSADVQQGIDFVGDYCPTATFLYILVNNAGTPVWRRITASSF